ncbi:protein DBF4 homolog A isoform X1 [Salmo trutta]|uniref:Protein DBF4 homolog A n=2 Tax=Salmo trutta TaxID=8032 RepID=A0A674BRD0_SALTR|nr:protein DBF4 homolog A-like isoform X1 [Salmo trutta]
MSISYNTGEHKDILFSSQIILNKMKSRRTQKSTKPRLQDPKLADKGHKSASKSHAKSPCESYPAQKKPFTGKLFYLDLPSNRRAETLENDIKRFGGTVEKFFSKEIKYLVSNKREARYVQCHGRDPLVPSPDSGHSSPHPRPRPGSHRDSLKGSSPGQADMVVISRGKSFVKRVVKEQVRIQVNEILSNALEWGVKILYIDDVIAYMEKKKRNVKYTAEKPTATTAAVKKSAKGEPTGKPAFQKYKGGRIRKPFVKVEDSSRHYRPIYLAMPNMPEFNLTSAPPCSPFYVEDQEHSGKRPKEHGNRGARVSASEERGQDRGRRNREKKRGGYCECCTLKYNNIKAHLQSEQHKAFSRSDEYLVVDRLITTLPFNFSHVKTTQTPTTRSKYSITSLLCVPGPSIQMEEEGGVETKELKGGLMSLWSTTVEPPLSQSVENPLEQPRKRSRGAPVPHSTSEGEKRCSYVPDRPQPKHRSLSCKQRCRQGSPRKHPQRAGLSQTPVSNAEIDPSTHDSVANPRLSHQGQRTHTDKDGRSSFGHTEDLQCGDPAVCVKVPSSQHEVAGPSEHHKLRALEESELSHDTLAGDTLPGNTGGVLELKAGDMETHTPPARTLQRRVRDYRRKRRKVEKQQTAQEQEKPSNVPSSSLLNLWQLFHSSEDMECEFRGFPSCSTPVRT